MLSDIVFISRNGPRWRDASSDYGPHKTLYNRCKRWGEMGVLLRMMEGLATADADPKTVMIARPISKRTARHRACELKGDLGRPIGRIKGGTNTKIYAVTDANGRPLSFFMTAGQFSDYIGAAALLDDLSKAQWPLSDRGCDADWFRDALQVKGVQPCIRGQRSRLEPIKCDKRRYRRRSRIEIMFGRLKEWRSVATRSDKYPTLFLSAIALAAVVIFWLYQRVLTLAPR